MARADAARNADRLLSAARELLSEQGPEVPLDEVAKRAGVGNATLYRHFPTRADLLVAVYADEVDRLVRLGAEADLFTWLGAYVEHVRTKRALAVAATDGPPGRRAELSGRWHQTITDTATALVARAAPQLRPGLTARDLLALATGVALTATDPDSARRLIALVRTGVQR
ncbi:helix-turn-helix domain-containing protein [Actinoplanes sp. NPDC051411]|uniref:TetR/AcrR family transcriptional regulator n=1 Tax=Actinoplanes sp. NPDC051411 TaxID=3155522 RepID=UPI00341A0B56